MDLHEQKRPLGANKLCKIQSKRRMIMLAWVTFQILSVKACFQVKKIDRATLFRKCLSSCLLSHGCLASCLSFLVNSMPVAGIFLLSKISNLGFVVQYYLFFFFSLFFLLFYLCQIRSDSVEADSSERSVCSSLIVSCLLYFASPGSPLLLWPGFLPFDSSDRCLCCLAKRAGRHCAHK